MWPPLPRPGQGMSVPWMLPLLLLLLGPGLLEASKYLYSEVVIPQTLDPKSGFSNKKEVSYVIRIEGSDRTIHLRQKFFIFRNMPVYSFNTEGKRQVQNPFIQVDCYYGGYVEALPDSNVILSTCHGLWGHIQIGQLQYEIHPFEGSSTHQHFLYRMAPEQQEPCRGIPDPQKQLPRHEIEFTPAAVSSEEKTEFPGADAPSRYLEYFAVCDNSIYQQKKKNVTQVILMVLQILSVLHNIYDDIGLHVVLTGIEVWTRQDLTGSDAGLQAFHDYVTSELRAQVHFDHAALFTAVGQHNSFGNSWEERFCLQDHVSVSSVRTSLSLTNDGVSAAHQLGHAVFGFVHDDLPELQGRRCGCTCTSEHGRCVMHSAVAGCHRFSNCSKNAYYEFLANRGKFCLLNLPRDSFESYSENTFNIKMCGNGVVEGKEECDCGRPEDLKELQDIASLSESRVQELKRLEECQKNDCCQEDCRRKPNAVCTHGLCCDNCKIVTEGKECREAASECDFPEYCNGVSAKCPPDVYKQNGMPCGTKDICYSGKCFNAHQQCEEIFGKGAKSAPLSCYKKVNMRGDRIGNCGRNKFGYKKCKEEDVLCGRIQCVNINKIPRFAAEHSVVQTPMDNLLCWGIVSHKGDDMHDAGAIADGSVCDDNKICIKRECVDLKVLNYDCNFTRCNNQGFCNSNKNCHCSYGWAPPYCAGKGFGGSLDSGPAPELSNTRRVVMLGSMLGIGLLLLATVIMFRNSIQTWFGRLISDRISPKPIDSASESTEQLSDEEEQSD
uniref:disintegrin and metalloproteinase domain-containing protein 9-like isoform X1 n=1 Tax=Podarcis muralis TaxID=64176 RepID=UPI0010A009F6|nr:disintegrin and metalloproteinase domain-containing protein 9-like isoform X1 [Podarcis muralis]